MKKSRTSRSAYATFRVFLAFALGMAGLSLGVTAFGAWPSLAAAMQDTSQKQAVLKAKTEAENRKRAAALKNMKAVRSAAVKSTLGGPAVPANTGPQVPPDSNAPRTISRHTNALGQTVHVISASRFDVSPPLAELA